MDNRNFKWYYGPIGGFAESIVMQPLDTIKVLKQSKQFPGTKYYFTSYKNFLGLYKGYYPFLSGMLLKYGIRFSVISNIKNKFSKDTNSFKVNFLSGIASGFTETLFTNPFELVKTREQTNTKVKGYVNNVIDVYNTKGLYGFYRGYLSMAFRQSINQSLNISIYCQIRNSDFYTPTPLNTVILGLISGSSGPILNNSFDVVKTRFQNKNYGYKTMLCAYKDIVKNEGKIYLFTSGLGLRILRVGFGQSIVFSIVEQLHKNNF